MQGDCVEGVRGESVEDGVLGVGRLSGLTAFSSCWPVSV